MGRGGSASHFLVIKVFHRGPYAPSSRSNGRESIATLHVGWGGVVSTSIYKEIHVYNNVIFQGNPDRLSPPPSSGSVHAPLPTLA